MKSPRQIASHRLWPEEGLVENPLISLSCEGEIGSVRSVEAPDREPLTEFYAGVIIPHFPTNYQEVFARMLAQREIPLSEQLPRWLVAEGCVVVLSGVDFSTLRLSDRAQILRL